MDNGAHQVEREAASDLVKRISHGDRLAEAEMVQRYSRGLRFLLRRRIRSPELVEDSLQETWLIALDRIRTGGLSNPGRLAGYLSGIANNLVRSELRRERRQKTTADSEIIERAADAGSSPFTSVSRAEVCRMVRDHLNELGRERDRQILRRFYVKEQAKDDICQALDVDGTHFNRVLFRARQRLKEAILRTEGRGSLRVVK